MTFEEFVINEEKKEYYNKLMDFVDDEYSNHLCHPSTL